MAKIPTCVGIGPTKTIAQVAKKVAKGIRGSSGVSGFSKEATPREAYRTISLSNVSSCFWSA
jgi:DNA polymerase V